MSEWQPMETAPTDGGANHEYLLWDGKQAHIAAVWWFDDDEHKMPAWFNGEYRVTPTHWMPLPEPPPLLSQEDAFQRAVKAGMWNGLVSKPEDAA